MNEFTAKMRELGFKRDWVKTRIDHEVRRPPPNAFRNIGVAIPVEVIEAEFTRIKGVPGSASEAKRKCLRAFRELVERVNANPQKSLIRPRGKTVTVTLWPNVKWPEAKKKQE